MSRPEIDHLLATLEALANVNQRYLELAEKMGKSVPKLAEAPVHYQCDAANEALRDIPRCLETGGIDAEAIVAWRVAELRRSGVAATIEIVTTPRDAWLHYGVRVRMPDGTTEDCVEDLRKRVSP